MVDEEVLACRPRALTRMSSMMIEASPRTLARMSSKSETVGRQRKLVRVCGIKHKENCLRGMPRMFSKMLSRLRMLMWMSGYTRTASSTMAVAKLAHRRDDLA